MSGISQRAPEINAADQRGVNESDRFVMPHSQWALSSVTVSDGRAADGGAGHDLTTRFAYFDTGFYDRAERESYGYAHVRTTRPDNAYADAFFFNQSYNRRGLLASVTEYSSSGVPLRGESHEYLEQAVMYGHGSVTFVGESASASVLYGNAGAIGQQTRTERTYDRLSPSEPEIVLTTVHDKGDVSTPFDDVTYSIGHFIGTASRCVRASSIVATSDAPSNGVATRYLPHRSANYDSKCFLTSLTDYVSGGKDANTLAGFADARLTTTFEPDVYGNIHRVVDPNDYFVVYERDPGLHQYIVDTFDYFGYHSTATWDFALGAQLTSTDVNNQKEAFHFDAYGRVVAVFAPGDPDTSATVSFDYGSPMGATASAPAWAVTHHRPRPGEDPIDTYTFVDGLGRVIQTQRESFVDRGTGGMAGHTSSGRVGFDVLGRVASQGQPEFVGSVPGTFALVAPHNVTTFDFDELSRPIHTHYPDGTDTTTSYTVEPAESSAPSGVSVWLRTVNTDQLHRHRVVFRDAAARILRVREFNQVGAIDYHPTPSDPTPNVTALDTDYFYDPLGRLERVRDASAHVTDVAYDSVGRRISILSPDTGLTEYQFDAHGNLGARITPNLRHQGAAIRNSYDHGRLEGTVYPDTILADGTHIPQRPTVFSYGLPLPAGGAPSTSNTAGRIIERRDDSGITTFEYGSLGETAHTSQRLYDPAVPGGLLAAMDTRHDYDRFGRMRHVTYPSGEEVSYDYDSGGALTRVGTCSSTSACAASNHTPTAYYVQEILYNEFGQRTSVTLANNVVSRYQYDPVTLRLAQLRTDAPAGGGVFDPSRTLRVQNMTYTYAANGNITDIVNDPESTGQGRVAHYAAHYEYDALDQIRSAAGNYSVPPAATGSSRPGSPVFSPDNVRQYTSSFAYDVIGRMKLNEQHDRSSSGGSPLHAVSDRVATYDYAFANTEIGRPLHAPARIDDAAVASHGADRIYHWDENGNQTGFETPASGETRSIVWNHENRIVSISDRATTGRVDVTSFRYDAGGNRTHKISTIDGAVALYPNQWSSVRGASRSGHAPTYDLITNHIYAGEMRVASNVISASSPSNRRAYWYHTDHLGSTNYVTNDTGQLVEHVEYFPFGEPWIEEDNSRARTSPGLPEDYLFSGKEWDEETRLSYFGARYYDARTGLWQSADMAGTRLSPERSPQVLNAYTYGLNSPIRLVDPDGNDVVDAHNFTNALNETWVGIQVHDPAGSQHIHVQQFIAQALTVTLESGRHVALRGPWVVPDNGTGRLSSDLRNHPIWNPDPMPGLPGPRYDVNGTRRQSILCPAGTCLETTDHPTPSHQQISDAIIYALVTHQLDKSDMVTGVDVTFRGESYGLHDNTIVGSRQWSFTYTNDQWDTNQDLGLRQTQSSPPSTAPMEHHGLRRAQREAFRHYYPQGIMPQSPRVMQRQ